MGHFVFGVNETLYLIVKKIPTHLNMIQAKIGGTTLLGACEGTKQPQEEWDALAWSMKPTLVALMFQEIIEFNLMW